MRTIRTTIRPDETIEVEEDEFADLSAQGLVKEEITAEAPKPKPATQGGTSNA